MVRVPPSHCHSCPHTPLPLSLPSSSQLFIISVFLFIDSLAAAADEADSAAAAAAAAAAAPIPTQPPRHGPQRWQRLPRRRRRHRSTGRSGGSAAAAATARDPEPRHAPPPQPLPLPPPLPPTGPAAQSQGLARPAPGSAEKLHVCLCTGIEQLHAGARPTSQTGSNIQQDKWTDI